MRVQFINFTFYIKHTQHTKPFRTENGTEPAAHRVLVCLQQKIYFSLSFPFLVLLLFLFFSFSMPFLGVGYTFTAYHTDRCNRTLAFSRTTKKKMREKKTENRIKAKINIKCRYIIHYPHWLHFTFQLLVCSFVCIEKERERQKEIGRERKRWSRACDRVASPCVCCVLCVSVPVIFNSFGYGLMSIKRNTRTGQMHLILSYYMASRHIMFGMVTVQIQIRVHLSLSM